jgi:type I restriction-modification system DNA methylase subunit
MDFACGSGSLLLNVRKKVNRRRHHRQDLRPGKEHHHLQPRPHEHAAARGEGHRVRDLPRRHPANEWDMMRELNPAKKPSFDAIVANPPFSYRWEPTDALADDVRFKSHGLAPKSAADFAFLLHGFHYLKDEGVMAIILPHGVLFRGGAEERIRTKLLKDGHIDTVIGLPANLFYSTGIPVCILVLKKCKKPDDVLFINAAEHFVKGKRQNQLSPEHIQDHRHLPVPQRRAPLLPPCGMAEIEKNDFNLNISRYISTASSLRRISAVPTVQIKYQTFHPSIWPKMIGEVSRDATPGALVQVLGKEGTPFGWGLWNPKSRMPLRVVSHSLEDLDETFFENAIRRAAEFRREILNLDAETDSYRAIHGDADFLPGIVADKFADVLSVEITNLAAWQRLPKWLPLLHECFRHQAGRGQRGFGSCPGGRNSTLRRGGIRCRALGEDP